MYRQINKPFSKQEQFLNQIKSPRGICCFKKQTTDLEEWLENENNELNDSKLTERNPNLDIRSDMHEPSISVADFDKQTSVPKNKIANAESTLAPDKSTSNDLKNLETNSLEFDKTGTNKQNEKIKPAEEKTSKNNKKIVLMSICEE